MTTECSDGLLLGKVVLVTGGAKRVGAAIVTKLHAAGANVVLHYRSAVVEAARLQAQLNACRPHSVCLCQADLLDMSGLKNMVEAAHGAWGRLDAVVNNASSYFPTPLDAIDECAWTDLIGTNLKAPLFLAQAAASYLRQTQGTIVNIVDIHAEVPLRDYLVYSVAKAGLLGLTRALALELGPDVRVNGVSPGAILWPEDQSISTDQQDCIVSRTALRRCGQPDDIARTVLFLVADAPYITGQILAVDGGRSVCQFD